MSQHGSTNKHNFFCACFSITSAVMLTMMITKELTRLRARVRSNVGALPHASKAAPALGIMTRSPQKSRGPHCDIVPHDSMRTRF